MLAIAGGILIVAAVLFAILISRAWLTGREGRVPGHHDWTKEARRLDPRFDEWSDFSGDDPDTSPPFERSRKQGDGMSESN
jgi:hypothetical protein